MKATVRIEYDGVTIHSEYEDEHAKRILDLVEELSFENKFPDLKGLERGLAHKWHLEDGKSVSQIRELLEIRKQQLALDEEFNKVFNAVD